MQPKAPAVVLRVSHDYVTSSYPWISGFVHSFCTRIPDPTALPHASVWAVFGCHIACSLRSKPSSCPNTPSHARPAHMRSPRCRQGQKNRVDERFLNASTAFIQVIFH